MRVIGAAEPVYDTKHHYHEASPFPARWVAHPAAPPGNASDVVFVCHYELAFDLPAAATVRVHVSADERYTLALDGRPIGTGPERGDRDHWSFETYDLPLAAGPHRLAARVHSLGRNRPYAQASVRHAFVLLAEGPLADTLSTGRAPWTARDERGYTPVPVALPKAFCAVGTRYRIAPADASPAVAVVDAGPFVLAGMRMESPGQWQLTPATLPPMLRRAIGGVTVRRLDGPGDVADWQAFFDGTSPLTVPPHATVHAIVDLNQYYCVYPTLGVTGGRGATATLAFAEALFEADGFTKRHRDRVDGLHFVGMGDVFVCDGHARTFEPPWWVAGRYARLSVVTQDKPLTLKAVALAETRYPFTWDAAFECDSAAVHALLPVTRRAMEMCSHETFYDCPYYEQLMYAGDARLEALVTYTHSADDRLPRKAVALFDWSRTPDGWTQARYPTKTTQVIPPFSAWWVAMVHDLAMWRDRPDDVAARMPGVRAVMEAAYARLDSGGLYRPGTGWHFVDWAHDWPGGAPPGASHRPTAPVHFQFAHAARLAAELEDAAGEPELAARHRRVHARMIAAGRAAFYDTGSGVFFDDLGRTRLSEHAQAIALLAGAAGPGEQDAIARALTTRTDLTRATVYYTHYVFEAFRLLGRVDALFDRLAVWSGLVENGFKTTFEQPEPTRSDCHAWGAHPMFHLMATVAGIRPAAAGFVTVRIEPQLGPLGHVRVSLPHPRGTIRARFDRRGDGITATVDLPAGVTGVLQLNGRSVPLNEGLNEAF